MALLIITLLVISTSSALNMPALPKIQLPKIQPPQIPNLNTQSLLTPISNVVNGTESTISNLFSGAAMTNLFNGAASGGALPNLLNGGALPNLLNSTALPNIINTLNNSALAESQRVSYSSTKFIATMPCLSPNHMTIIKKCEATLNSVRFHPQMTLQSAQCILPQMGVWNRTGKDACTGKVDVNGIKNQIITTSLLPDQMKQAASQSFQMCVTTMQGATTAYGQVYQLVDPSTSSTRFEDCLMSPWRNEFVLVEGSHIVGCAYYALQQSGCSPVPPVPVSL